MERNLLVDPELRVESQKTATLEPSPQPWREHLFTVGLSSGVKFEIDRVFEAVDKVIDLIGPHPCISGFDVLFRDELQTVVVNDNLEAQRFGQSF
jgi:hypothetical protein